MAIFQPVNKSITHAQCLQYSRFNCDGFGFAFVDNKNDLIVKKTTNFNNFYNQYCQTLSRYNESSPFIIHFRLGTSGIVSQENCHPFYINKDVCFIHNGIFRELSNDPILSDTNLFNKRILQLSPDINKIFTNTPVFDNYNKLVFLNSNKQHAIVNESNGHWQDGIWYSNYSYF